MADELTLAALLSDSGIPYRLTEVGPARTAQEAADALDAPLERIVKSLVCLVDDRPVIAMVPGNRSLSLEKLRAAAGANAAVLAKGKTVERATGYVVGAVAPIGHPSQLPLFGDSAVASLPAAYFGGGSHRHMLLLAPTALETFTRVVWADLAGDER